MKLSDVPAEIGLEIVRDGSFESVGFVTYTTSQLLVFTESEKYLADLAANKEISCVITTAELAPKLPPHVGVAVAKSPRGAFYALHNKLAETEFYWKPFRTEIAASARVHPRAYVAEWNVRIGERCVVEPHATVLERAVLEDDVVLRAGVIVAGEGFQFAQVDGKLLPVVHVGGVRLERGVELQNGTCVDRAIFGGFTVVGEETKTDNMVHIAHNCRLGKRNRLAACAMLAGSIVSGDDVWFGPACAVSDGVKIGSRASLTIGAVVTRDVGEDQRVSGNFAIDHGRFLTHMRAIR
ncbi:MAG: UDP-3-O-(3-hydroxymyristoyl)glucosamine N-acyltransferase [Myxococcales bacterium]|nr:UDP-3-O-(3-hydroxymyristoyl)glucosamine N-acyltransferase [Myxococcales bacterium]